MEIRARLIETWLLRIAGSALATVGVMAMGAARAAGTTPVTGFGSAEAVVSGPESSYGAGAARRLPFQITGVPGGWNILPSLSLREIYDDNIALAVPGQEQSDFVTEVNPAISIDKHTRRFDLLTNYRMENIFYAKNSSNNSTFHQLFSKLDAEVVPETFSMGAQASASQALISPSNSVALSNISITSNRTNVVTYSATPRFQHAFGRLAIARAHYTYSVVDYNTQQLSGSQTGEVGASIGTGPDVTGFGFDLDYNRSRTNFDGAPDVIFESLIGELRYPAQYRFRLVLRGGYENNNFQFGPNVAQPKGKIWSAGFQWDLSPRSHLQASYGRRFFGRTINASFQHEGAWTSASVDFTEEPTTVSELVLDQQPLVMGPNGQFVQVLAPSLPALSAQVFINRQVSGTFGLHGSWDQLSATVLHSERTFELTGSKETVTGVDASWIRRFGPRVSSNITGYWQRRNFIGGVQVDDLWQVAGGLGYQFAQYVHGSLAVTHSQRTSNLTGDYFVNMVSLGVTVGF